MTDGLKISGDNVVNGPFKNWLPNIVLPTSTAGTVNHDDRRLRKGRKKVDHIPFVIPPSTSKLVPVT